jgi:hypothetical protein
VIVFPFNFFCCFQYLIAFSNLSFISSLYCCSFVSKSFHISKAFAKVTLSACSLCKLESLFADPNILDFDYYCRIHILLIFIDNLIVFFMVWNISFDCAICIFNIFHTALVAVFPPVCLPLLFDTSRKRSNSKCFAVTHQLFSLDNVHFSVFLLSMFQKVYCFHQG